MNLLDEKIDDIGDILRARERSEPLNEEKQWSSDLCMIRFVEDPQADSENLTYSQPKSTVSGLVKMLPLSSQPGSPEGSAVF